MNFLKIIFLTLFFGFIGSEVKTQIQQIGNFEYPDVEATISPKNPGICNLDLGVKVTCNEDFLYYKWMKGANILSEGKKENGKHEILIKEPGDDYNLIITYDKECTKELKFKVKNLKDVKQIKAYFENAGFWAIPIFRDDHTVLCRNCICEDQLESISFSQTGNKVKLYESKFEKFNTFKPLQNFSYNKIISNNDCLCLNDNPNYSEFENQFYDSELGFWGHQYFEDNSSKEGLLFAKATMPWQENSPKDDVHKNEMTGVLGQTETTEEQGRIIVTGMFMTHHNTPSENQSQGAPCGEFVNDFRERYVFTESGYPVQIPNSSFNPYYNGEKVASSGFSGALWKFTQGDKEWISHYFPMLSGNIYAGFYYRYGAKIFDEFSTPTSLPFDYILPAKKNDDNYCSVTLETGKTFSLGTSSNSTNGGIGAMVKQNFNEQVVYNKSETKSHKQNLCPAPLDLPFDWQSRYNGVIKNGYTIWFTKTIYGEKWVATLSDDYNNNLIYFVWNEETKCWQLINQIEISIPGLIVKEEIIQRFNDYAAFLHTALDVASYHPLYGIPFGLVNGYLYSIEGNSTEAKWAMVGVLFDGASFIRIGGKVAIKGTNSAGEIIIEDGFKPVLTTADDGFVAFPLEDVTKALEDAIKNLPVTMGNLESWSRQLTKDLASDVNFYHAITDITADGPKLIKGWVELLGTPARKNIAVLRTVTNLVDVAGIKGLKYQVVDGVTEILSKKEVIGRFTDDALEIADDNFIPRPNTGVTSITEIAVRTTSSLEETIINPGVVRSADGTFLGFVEDVSSYGTALVQNAIKGRRLLRDALGNVPFGWEAHHIIPVQLLKVNQLVKKAVEAGFDFNGIINGLPLEKYVADTGLGRHGPHPSYTTQIEEHLIRWGEITVNNIKNRDLPAEEIANYLTNLSSNIKNKILTSTGRINLLNLNLP